MRGRAGIRAPTWLVVMVVGSALMLSVYVPIAVSRGWSLAWLDAATGQWGTFASATTIMAAALLWVYLKYQIWRRNIRAWVLLVGFLVLHCWVWAAVLRANPHLHLIYFSIYGPVELCAYGWVLFTFCLDTNPHRRRPRRHGGAHSSLPPNPKGPA